MLACLISHADDIFPLAGENLAQYFQNFQSVTQAWYDEVKDYHYDGQFSEATGHFTQVRHALLLTASTAELAQ